MKKSRKNHIIENGIIFLIIVLVSILSHFFQDFIYVFILLSISVLIFLYSFRERYSLFLRYTSIFVFLHFIVFPLIYVFLIKQNPESFEFSKQIYKNEKDFSISNINSIYSPKEIKKQLKVINNLLDDNSSKLDTTFKYINKGNILITPKFILSKNSIRDLRFNRPASRVVLNVTNLKGIQLAEIYSNQEGHSFYDSNKKIRNFLIERKKKLTIKLNEFQKDFKSIVENKNIWSYRQILSYSINIFFTDNMIPKTRTANILYFFHQIIVVVFLLGLISNQLPIKWEKQIVKSKK